MAFSRSAHSLKSCLRGRRRRFIFASIIAVIGAVFLIWTAVSPSSHKPAPASEAPAEVQDVAPREPPPTPDLAQSTRVDADVKLVPDLSTDDGVIASTCSTFAAELCSENASFNTPRANLEAILHNVVEFALGLDESAGSRAYTKLRELQGSENPVALFHVGAYYHAKSDMSSALPLYEKSSSQGYGRASAALGILFAGSDGKGSTYSEGGDQVAIRYLKLAIDQGIDATSVRPTLAAALISRAARRDVSASEKLEVCIEAKAHISRTMQPVVVEYLSARYRQICA